MPVPRRLWDSGVIIAYLSGAKLARPTCDFVLNEAASGKLEIMVSTIAAAEVAYLPGVSDADSEAKIREFFSRNYVVVAAISIPVTTIARRLIRENRPSLQGADAIHIATALLWHVPIIESFDPHLLKLDAKVGNPPLIIRPPTYEGTLPMFPVSS